MPSSLVASSRRHHFISVSRSEMSSTVYPCFDMSSWPWTTFVVCLSSSSTSCNHPAPTSTTSKLVSGIIPSPMVGCTSLPSPARNHKTFGATWSTYRYWWSSTVEWLACTSSGWLVRRPLDGASTWWSLVTSSTSRRRDAPNSWPSHSHNYSIVSSVGCWCVATNPPCH